MQKNELLVIDIETTGFLDQGGLIVEVGIVKLDLTNGKVDIIFDRVCREKNFDEKHSEQPYGWIFKNSNLTIEDVEKAESFDSMLPEIQEIINYFQNGCTAFNRAFDIPFLENRGLKFGKLQPCPMRESINVLMLPPTEKMKMYKPSIKYKTPNVEEAWKFLFPNIPYVELHRAADDALHEAMIVYELYKKGFYKCVIK